MSCSRLDMRDIRDFSTNELMRELYLREVSDSDFIKFSLKAQSEEDLIKKEPKNLGSRRVGKSGIVIGKDPDKKLLSHSVLCNYVGDSIPLFQDETGYFVLHSEEKVYLYDDKNIGHLVKDRSNISDQKDRPNFTSIRDRTIWELMNSPSQQ